MSQQMDDAMAAIVEHDFLEQGGDRFGRWRAPEAPESSFTSATIYALQRRGWVNVSGPWNKLRATWARRDKSNGDH